MVSPFSKHAGPQLHFHVLGLTAATYWVSDVKVILLKPLRLYFPPPDLMTHDL
jgi:hypothetical protein